MLTGLHGSHIIFGAIFLSVVFYRVYKFNNPSVIFDLSMLY